MIFHHLYAAVLVAALIGSAIACASPDSDDQRVLSPYEDAGDDVGNSFDVATEDTDTNADTADTGPPDAALDADDDDAATDTGNGTDAAPSNGDHCQPVGDGIIRHDRVPVEIGTSAPYQFSLDVDIDTAGEEVAGSRVWDLSQSYADDFVEDVAFEALDDHWFGEEFPDATYAAPLSAGDDDEYGIFEFTDDALLMVGVASPDDGYYRTELRYEPPVEILSFPLEEGDSWSTETRASGAYGGNHFHGHDEIYATEVDAAGELSTPFGTFPVLRVNTWLEQEVWMGGMVWVTSEFRTHTFVAECFGTVARIRSEEDDADEEFDRAAEVMRLSQ